MEVINRIKGVFSYDGLEWNCFIHDKEIMIEFNSSCAKGMHVFSEFGNKSFLVKVENNHPYFYYVFIGNNIYFGDDSSYYNMKMIVPLSNTSNHIIKSINFGSAGFINFFNDEAKYLLIKPLSFARRKLCETKVIINNKVYSLKAWNEILYSNLKERKNGMPYEMNTFISLESSSFELGDLLDLYNWTKSLLTFITINRYTKIDLFMCMLDNESSGGYLEPQLFTEKDNVIGIDRVLSYSCMKKNCEVFFNNVNKFFLYPHRLFLYDDNVIHDFDIVLITGTFERVFDKYVTETVLKKKIERMKKGIQLDQLNEMLKKHRNKIKEEYKEDFNNAITVVSKYTMSLKSKLSFIYEDFLKTMKYDSDKIKKFSFFYNPSKLEKRLKDARNDICHGLENPDVDWSGALNDCLVVQEFIYFIILKYCLKESNIMIKKNLSKAYPANKGIFSDYSF